MTVFLTVLCALVGALCLLNILLTVGVIRRLKEHTETIGHLRSTVPALPEQVILPAGEEVADFSAETVDGTTVNRADLEGETLVGVFSPGCPACTEQLPRFTDLAASFPGGRDRVLAVVVGEAADAAHEIAQLTPVARVVQEEHGGTTAPAFGVNGFPAMARVDATGRVLASGYSVEAVEALSGV
ncbi:TlpA disulfide reductase family protein [Nocardiopsis sp. CNT312]|uniref:TlpA family protein disulfide reductase n=1 Tax=Nocardiopsis sp. CNT312 TaxID=1137268 RepID=UPI0004B58D5B|nr:TlpA disulfide reductase family protein [Nocardiopsis sp. CNT312]